MSRLTSTVLTARECATSENEDCLDSGLRCLMLMAALHGIPADEDALRHAFGHGRPFNSENILLAAQSIGFRAKKLRQEARRLHLAPLPAIAQDKKGRYFIVAKFVREGTAGEGERVLIQRPGETPQILALAQFLDIWTEQLVFMTSKLSVASDLSRFDFTWFIPAVVKYRRLLGEVLFISLVLQLIGLALPIAFQVVMDKVLVNHAMKTLNVVAIGLICATMFEAVLTGIRTYALAHTSSKIDVELGAKLFTHLLHLPLAYFQTRRVGDSVARVRELESIRAFLTSNAMTLMLDVLFSFVFLSAMFWYSSQLALIVLVSIPVYFILSLVFTPNTTRSAE